MKQRPSFLFAALCMWLLITIVMYNKAFDSKVYIPLVVISAGFCGYTLSRFESVFKRRERRVKPE